MKLILIASTPESIISFRGKLIKALCSHGIKVFVCAPFTEKHKNIIQELNDVYMVETYSTALNKAKINIISDFRYIVRLIKIIKSIKPNFMISYTMKPVIYGSIAGWFCNVPFRFSIITGLGFIFSDSQNF